MPEVYPRTPESDRAPRDLNGAQLAIALRALGDRLPDGTAIVYEAAARVERLQNLSKLLGRLAPGGTAPRTALEHIWDRAETSSEVDPVLLELSAMLEKHYGEWTPAIREVEGLPPKDSDEETVSEE